MQTRSKSRIFEPKLQQPTLLQPTLNLPLLRKQLLNLIGTKPLRQNMMLCSEITLGNLFHFPLVVPPLVVQQAKCSGYRSSTAAEYRSLVDTTFEIYWL